MPKRLVALGCASLLIIATVGRLGAQDATPAGTPATKAGSTDDTPPPPDDSALPPDNPQVAPSSQIPTAPLLPQQVGNVYSPFATVPTTLNAQAPEITSPSLFTTGTTDISVAATNNALLQAFSSPSTPGFLTSEQEGGYSHPPIERIRLGPVDLKAALATNIVYDDDIRNNNNGLGSGVGVTQTGAKESDFSYNVTPAVLFVYGEHEGQRGYATLVYSPTISRYFHYSNNDSDDQNVALNVQYPFQRLTLNLSESYSQTTGVNQDLNTRTTQTSNAIVFGGSYLIDEKLTLTTQFQNIITSFSNPGGQQGTGVGPNNGAGNGGEITSINNALVYRVSDKITVGPSINVGVDKPDNEGQETFEQGLVGITYQPTQKINFYLQAGAELRQSDQSNDQFGTNGDNGDEVNPIFSAGVGYNPFDSTTLTLNASQSVHTSDANGTQSVVNTSVGVAATQRFFQRLFLNLSFDYSHDENQGGVAAGNTLSENDDNLSYRTSLSIAPTAWSSVSVYYQYLDNESNTAADSYHDNQIGLAVSAQF